jgi:hypothetical protein
MAIRQGTLRLGSCPLTTGPRVGTRNVFNRAVAFSTHPGVSILGSRVLAVRGNASGAWRTTPVNLLDHDGRRYLVSTRGHGLGSNGRSDRQLF